MKHLLFFILFLLPFYTYSQDNKKLWYGNIEDTNGKAVSSVRLEISAGASATTDKYGKFIISVPESAIGLDLKITINDKNYKVKNIIVGRDTYSSEDLIRIPKYLENNYLRIITWLPNNEEKNCICCYQSNDTSFFKILVLPLNKVYKSGSNDSDIGFLIKERILNLIHLERLNTSVEYLNSFKPSLNFDNSSDSLQLVLDQCGKDLLIYGYYVDDNNFNNPHLGLKYYLSDKIEKGYREDLAIYFNNKRSISSLKEVSVGRIQDDNQLFKSLDFTIHTILGVSEVFKGPIGSKTGREILNKIEEDDRNATYFYAVSVSYFNEGNYIKAIELLTKAIELNPEYVDAYSLRAESEWQRLEHLEVKRFEVITSSYFKDPIRNKSYYNNQVVSDLEKAIQLKSNEYSVYQLSAWIKLDTKDFKGAIEDATMANKIDSSIERNYYILYKAIEQIYGLNEAFKDYYRMENINAKQSKEKNSLFSQEDLSKIDSCKFYLLRGLFKKREEFYNAAIKDFSNSLRIDSNFVAAYIGRSDCRYRLNDIQGYLNDITKAINLKPYYPQLFFDRGSVRYNISDYTGAVEDFTKELELNNYFKGEELYPVLGFDSKFNIAFDTFLFRGKSYYKLQKKSAACSDWLEAKKIWNNDEVNKLIKNNCNKK